MGDIVSESTGDFISVRLGDFVGIRIYSFWIGTAIKIRITDECSEQDKVRYTLRAGNGEHCSHGATLGKSERGRRGEPISSITARTHPGVAQAWGHRIFCRIAPGHVCHGNASEFRKALQESYISRYFMQEFDVRDNSRNQDDIDGAVTHYLIAMLTYPLAAQRVNG
ncbi:hypothetical protein [Bradyrhizobium lupini]